MKTYNNNLEGFTEYCKNNPLMFSAKPLHFVKNKHKTLYGDSYYIALSANPNSKEKSSLPIGTLGRFEGKVDVLLRMYDNESKTFKKYTGIEVGILHAYFLEDIYLFASVNLLYLEDLLEIK
ncbi:hypothetical protein [Sutcliffiella sp. BMC8]|uniref:hypothetical protein n=1 Tax=Sutcliffiella sp. BMC8 TaxID=3073243 RepID=UPI0030D4940B